jgi:FkbH-like protein
MVLKKEHIASYQINWDDKPFNLRKISENLNIGLDSLVFIDDSEFEVNLVRKEAPEVTAIHFDVNKAVLYRDQLAGCGLFDTLTISDEDKMRHRAYQEEFSRKNLKAKATDLESYLRSLSMILEVRFCDEISLPRIAQLTQKTNQFNLTTRRYTEQDISNFSQSKDIDVLYVRLHDRFGDMGIIGVSITRYKEDRAEIDSFLLSCRALGRTVEQAFLKQCLRRAQTRGSQAVIGVYLPTAKNNQVREFYLNQGFSQISGGDNGDRFQLSLPDYHSSSLNCFSAIRSDIFGEDIKSK